MRTTLLQQQQQQKKKKTIATFLLRWHTRLHHQAQKLQVGRHKEEGVRQQKYLGENKANEAKESTAVLTLADVICQRI
jgi:hypothetical protein